MDTDSSVGRSPCNVVSHGELKGRFGIKFCKVHILRLEKKGLFPSRIYLGSNTVVWSEQAIMEWLEAKTKSRPAPVVASQVEINHVRSESSKIAMSEKPEFRVVPHDTLLSLAVPATESAQCGIYMLLQGDVVVYVGQSLNVVGRIRTHHRNSTKFDRYTWVQALPHELDRLETLYIRHYQPELNKTSGSKRYALSA